MRNDLARQVYNGTSALPGKYQEDVSLQDPNYFYDLFECEGLKNRFDDTVFNAFLFLYETDSNKLAKELEKEAESKNVSSFLSQILFHALAYGELKRDKTRLSEENLIGKNSLEVNVLQTEINIENKESETQVFTVENARIIDGKSDETRVASQVFEELNVLQDNQTVFKIEKSCILSRSPESSTISSKNRKDELKELMDIIATNKQNVALYGADGIGKRELAIRTFEEVAKRGSFDYLIWINCGLYKSDLELAICDALTDIDIDIIQRKKLMREYVNKYSDSLLVVIDRYTPSQENSLLEELRDMGCTILVVADKKISGLDFQPYRLPLLNRNNGCRQFNENYLWEEEEEELILAIGNEANWHTATLELISKLAQFAEISLKKISDKILFLFRNKDFPQKIINIAEYNEFIETIAVHQIRMLFLEVHPKLTNEETRLLDKFAVFSGLLFTKQQIVKWFRLNNEASLRKVLRFGFIKESTIMNETTGTQACYFMDPITANSLIKESLLGELFVELNPMISELINLDNEAPLQLNKSSIPYLMKINEIFKTQINEKNRHLTYLIPLINTEPSKYSAPQHTEHFKLNILNESDINYSDKAAMFGQLGSWHHCNQDFENAELNYLKSLWLYKYSENINHSHYKMISEQLSLLRRF